MDTFLKSLAIGFLLRSLFAGVFFVFSYMLATEGFKAPDLGEFAQADAAKTLWLLLPVAFFLGMTTYVVHRSFFYPLIECWIDSRRMKARRKVWPLIRPGTVKTFLARWDYGGQTDGSNKTPANKDARLKHLLNWADHTHFQYVAALCVASGAWVGDQLRPIPDSPFGTLIAFALFQAVLAFISDWRIRTVWDAVLKPTPVSTSTSQPTTTPTKHS